MVRRGQPRNEVEAGVKKAVRHATEDGSQVY
jgi:hypothetical protein